MDRPQHSRRQKLDLFGVDERVELRLLLDSEPLVSGAPSAPERSGEMLDDGVGLHFAKLAATLDGCRSVPVSRARLDACAGAGLAVLRASATGTAVDHHVLAPWPILRATLELALPLGPIELRAIAALDAAPTWPRFEISGVGDVHRVDTLALAFALGVAWSL